MSLTMIRVATEADVPELQALIARSARGLAAGFYTAEQAEAAIANVFGVDKLLIHDGTYFVAEADGVAVGCGGWSYRETLFGGDQFVDRSPARIDPAMGAARIRAFFIDPGQARSGLGSRLLAHCEAAAAADGFTRCTLVATMPGEPFYAARGYVAVEPVVLTFDGVEVRFVSMDKVL
jgi:N-acetylglutamate synthase-like GNAT family acetyltransferase